MKRLVETPDNPSPDGAALGVVTAADGVKLRAAVWQPKGAPLGTVVVCTGRTEFIEKYFELIGEFLSRNYAVVCFDWRGQGLSDRLLDDRGKGHVRRFADYDLDLDAIVAGPLADLPKPWVLFGHSMGGHVGLRFLARRPEVFERALLSAPMLKIWLAAPLRLIAAALARVLCWAGQREAYVPGGKGNDGFGIPFEDNRVTTDRRRYVRNIDILRADRTLGIGGPTWGWIDEAFTSMRRLRKPAFAKLIRCPLMIVGAAHDQIVHQGADLSLVRQVKHGLFVLFSDAQHELVQESDHIRGVFWHAADAFLEAPSESLS